MKREEVKKIFPDATDEQVNAIMAAHGAAVEKEKGKATALEAELKDTKEALTKLSGDFDALKATNASAEDYKAKFDALTKEVAEKEAKAKADAEAKAKAERIASRFGAVVGEKKFSHDAIRKDYLARFTAALEAEENAGKSDADILHELTKDDAGAFQNVTAVKLAGGKNGTPPAKDDDAKVRAIMGLPPEK